MAEHAAALAVACPETLPGRVRERFEDLLRPDTVAAAWRAASAPGAGERARRRLRALAPAWLDRAAGEPMRELRERDPGPDPGLWTAPDPQHRRRLYTERAVALERLEGLREEWVAARADAATRVGAPDVSTLLAALHPVDPGATAAAFETGAVAPLDDAVAAAVRARRRHWPRPLLQPPHPADARVLRDAVGFAPDYGRGALVRALERTAEAFGERLTVMPDDGWAFAPGSAAGAPEVTVGLVAGPGALPAGLAAVGAALRGAFVRNARGLAAERYADPAFRHAAEVVFRRLALEPGFRARYGPPVEPGLEAALRLEEALAPRRAWNYLDLVSSRTAPHGSGGDSRDLDAAFRRALGEPPTVDERLVPASTDPAGAAVLRGTALGLLQEERLRSRWGYAWYAERGAVRWLLEAWEAEPDETAESMATLADLGTIEPTPVLDRCRPEFGPRR